jgi:hypothetical protein
MLVAIVVLPILAMVVPLAIYIWAVWEARKREVSCCMITPVLRRYFETFYPTDLGPKGTKWTPEALAHMFNHHYDRCFGRSKFILPASLLTVMAAVFWVFTAQSLKPWLSAFFGAGNAPESPSFVLAGLAGFAGGYMWVLLFLARRMQQRQLTPFDLYAGGIRLVVAVPVALSFAALFQGVLQAQVLPAIAFMLGAFPTTALVTFMRRTASSKLNLQDSFDDPATNLTQLQGIERDHGEILSTEGVCTILQLAYSDPVDLTIRTGFSFSYVVDCCSQALAWLYLPEEIPKLRRFGLRGAMEICTFVYELTRATRQDKATMDQEEEWATKTLDVVAADLGMDKDALRRTFDEIAYDPYTQFLYDVWQPSWN